MGDGEAPFWRAFHWGLFDDPEREDDSPERYFVAGGAMTEHLIAAAGVTDGSRLLDVGCGFGGTVDHIAVRNQGCRLAGLNIDERQVREARELLEKHGWWRGTPIPFLVGDGNKLPIAPNSLDHVLAVECIFHFPSRKDFLREAARVLKPGGTVALSDFVSPPGALRTVAHTMSGSGALDDQNWYGRMNKPLTPAGYRRYGRSAGLDLLSDDDVTARTLPTYPALRRLYRETGADESQGSVDSLETLARSGHLQYHVIAFRKPDGREA
jgi:SAM-dependent methyltransferase